jgi:hypothetical protein
MPYISSINTGLPNIPDPPSPELFAEFQRLYNAIRNLTISIDSYTGNTPQAPDLYSKLTDQSSLLTQRSCKIYVQFTQAVPQGYLVNVYDTGGGNRGGRLASATSAATKCTGWLTSNTVAAGEWGEITLMGLSKTFNSLIISSTYYLSNTPGLVSSAPGTINQKVGTALSTTSLFLRPEFI